MDPEKFQFTALGVYLLGYEMEQLEWAIASIDDCKKIASFFGQFRICEEIHSFEDIGHEAKIYEDKLSNLEKNDLNEAKNNLRDVRAHWDALARERLQDLYLVTPMSRMEPKCLMKGTEGVVGIEHLPLLTLIEVSDISEACKCILIGSATAAEHIALRAAESLLRRWYEYKTGNKLKRGTWGTVLDKLVKEYPEQNRPKEIALLGYLKQRRDEVAHPERISKLTEAEATLLNVCSLIEGIKPVLTELSLITEPNTQLLIANTNVGTKNE